LKLEYLARIDEKLECTKLAGPLNSQPTKSAIALINIESWKSLDRLNLEEPNSAELLNLDLSMSAMPLKLDEWKYAHPLNVYPLK